MAAKSENKLLAVIRVRGRAGVRHDIKETLTRLNLDRVNNLALISGTKPNMGMIKKCNDFVTYGELNEEMLQKIAEKKGIKASKDDLHGVFTGSKRVRDVLQLPIHMHPPRRGYHGAKISFGIGGALGYRSERINELIKRMM